MIMKLWIVDLEEWVVCEDYPSYIINREGQVKSSLTNKILKTARLKTGYVCVGLRKGGKSYTVRLHRLLAKAFIPNPHNKPHVDHINGVRDDNRLENLRWCTCKENIQHAISHKLIDNTKQVSMYSLDGNFIKEFDSITDAEKETGVFGVNISACCKHKIRQSGSYQWRYEKLDTIEKVRPKKIAEDLRTRCCKQVDMYNGIVKVQSFASVLDAAKFIGKPNAQANISACALGKRKTAYGYGWTYVD